jgi:hypothetical protein
MKRSISLPLIISSFYCRFETRNLLVARKDDLDVIGKAEGLKVMLIDWLRRHDGVYRYFSDPKYSYGRTRGDITEVTKRRTWKEVPMWMSDSTIQFSPPSKFTPQGDYARNEYIYIGRTLPGVLKLESITIRGANASYFSVSPTNGSIGQYSSLRIKVSFYSATALNVTRLGAFLDVRTSEQRETVRIYWPPQPLQ